MKPDGLEELKELIAFLRENEIAEFDLDKGDLKVRLKFASAVAPAAPAASAGVDLASLGRPRKCCTLLSRRLWGRSMSRLRRGRRPLL